MSINEDITEPIDSLHALRREFREAASRRETVSLGTRTSELRKLDRRIAELTIDLLQDTLRRLDR